MNASAKSLTCQAQIKVLAKVLGLVAAPLKAIDKVLGFNAALVLHPKYSVLIEGEARRRHAGSQQTVVLRRKAWRRCGRHRWAVEVARLGRRSQMMDSERCGGCSGPASSHPAPDCARSELVDLAFDVFKQQKHKCK